MFLSWQVDGFMVYEPCFVSRANNGITEARNPHAQNTNPHPLQHHLAGVATSSAQPLSDPNAYPLPSPVALSQHPGHPLRNINIESALDLDDPVVSYTVNRAFAEVRAADRNARQLMMIEIQAKQLALSIVAREEDRERDEPPGPPGGMGDEGGD